MCSGSRAVAALTAAVKLNYEIYGNTLPHLHLYVFPRCAGGPFESGPVDPQAVRRPVYGLGEFYEFAARLRTMLVAAGAP
jgi:diadenosine tetraphosphate (Ap4A) HIT family hydrolase